MDNHKRRRVLALLITVTVILSLRLCILGDKIFFFFLSIGLQNKQAAHPESCAKAFRMQARGEVKEYSLLAHTKKKKIIYLIRHAQALHNVEEKKEMDRVRVRFSQILHAFTA